MNSTTVKYIWLLCNTCSVYFHTKTNKPLEKLKLCLPTYRVMYNNIILQNNDQIKWFNVSALIVLGVNEPVSIWLALNTSNAPAASSPAGGATGKLGVYSQVHVCLDSILLTEETKDQLVWPHDCRGTASLVFTDDKSSRMNSAEWSFRAKLSALILQNSLDGASQCRRTLSWI